MGAELKPAGRAVAVIRGHYPLADGRIVTVKPGEEFTVFEGRTKASWFKLLNEGEPAPVVEVVAPPAEPDTLAAAAVVEHKRKAKVKAPMAADDIV